MFKVQSRYSDTAYMVYSVYRPNNSSAMFLIYNHRLGTWEWDSADLYKPYIEDDE